MWYSVIVVLPMHFSQLFQVQYIVRRVMEVRKSGMPCFSCRSLLLSTNLLNDIYVYTCIYIYMLNKNTLSVKKVRGQSEATMVI